MGLNSLFSTHEKETHYSLFPKPSSLLSHNFTQTYALSGTMNCLIVFAFLCGRLSLVTAAPQTYPTSELFVLDVKGVVVNGTLLNNSQFSAVAESTALNAFAKHFGSYTLVPPGKTVIFNSTDRRKLFKIETCPSSCRPGLSSTQCVALHCVTKARGTKRALLQRSTATLSSNETLSSNGTTFEFDLEAAQQSITNALKTLAAEQNIPLNSVVAPNSEYQQPLFQLGDHDYVVSCQDYTHLNDPVCAWRFSQLFFYSFNDDFKNASLSFRNTYYLVDGINNETNVEILTAPNRLGLYESITVDWYSTGTCDAYVTHWETTFSADGQASPAQPVSLELCNSCAICNFNTTENIFQFLFKAYEISVDCTNIKDGVALVCEPISSWLWTYDEIFYPLNQSYHNPAGTPVITPFQNNQTYDANATVSSGLEFCAANASVYAGQNENTLGGSRVGWVTEQYPSGPYYLGPTRVTLYAGNEFQTDECQAYVNIVDTDSGIEDANGLDCGGPSIIDRCDSGWLYQPWYQKSNGCPASNISITDAGCVLCNGKNKTVPGLCNLTIVSDRNPFFSDFVQVDDTGGFGTFLYFVVKVCDVNNPRCYEHTCTICVDRPDPSCRAFLKEEASLFKIRKNRTGRTFHCPADWLANNHSFACPDTMSTTSIQ